MYRTALRSLSGLFALALVISLVGCDSFTDIEPKGSLSGDQLETPAGAEALVRAAYAALDGALSSDADQIPTFFNPPSNWSFGDVRSDDAYKGGGGTGDILEVHLIEINSGLRPTNFVIDRKWSAGFQGIQRANQAIRALEGLTEEEFPRKQQRIAEMRFLRGHFYFDLKKIFNRVPWIDETVGSEEIRQISNTDLTSEQLWNNIAADFQFAADNLPDVPGEAGRADRFAATAYLAKVALFRGQWQEVIQLTDQVINSGMYDLLDRYDDLSRATVFDNSREDVFSIQFSVSDGSSLGNINWGDLLLMPTTDACGGGGDGFLRPSQNLVNAYRVDENGLPLFNTFNEEDMSPDNPPADAKPVDPRLDLTVTRVGIPWKGFHDTTEGQASAAPVPDPSWMRQASVYGLYARKKNIEPPASSLQVDGFPWCGSALNFPIIRYAEVLLWKAEALVESGADLEEARRLVNLIRERAANDEAWIRTVDDETFAANYQIGLYPASVWTPDYARQAIRFETRLELALEGHRFFNLVRWDIADQVLPQYYAEETNDAGYYGSAIFTPGVHEYLPIPQNQIDISEGLYQQNMGY